MVAVAVQHQTTAMAFQDLVQPFGIHQPFTVLDGFRVWWVVDQNHLELFPGRIQAFGQPLALLGAHRARGQEWRGCRGRIESYDCQGAAFSDEGECQAARFRLTIGPPHTERIGALGGDVTVVVAGDDGDVFRAADAGQPLERLVELIGQADLGQVTGDDRMVGGLLPKVLDQCGQNLGAVLVAAPEIPGQIAKQPLVGDVEGVGEPGLGQMRIGKMGETENGLHELRSWMEAVIGTPVPEAVIELAHELRKLHGPCVEAIVMYGSCLRSGDPFDGLVDLYLLVDDYNRAYDRRWLAWANRWLPPNVFYHQMTHEGKVIRTKYAVISCADFERGMSGWFHSYLWGRFAQPCRLIYARDRERVRWAAETLLQAGLRFVAETVPVLPPCFAWRTLWQTGLRLSYSAELRTEKADRRALELVDHTDGYFQRLTFPLLAALPYALKQDDSGRFCLDISKTRRFRARIKWRVRRIQGKILSLLRLIKSLFTFQGGVDYILWKLERHSGRRIEVSPRVRRYPLIYGWGVLWRLYREGVFR